MNLMARFRSWLKWVVGQRLESEMETEVRFHIESYAADLVRKGLSQQDAQFRTGFPQKDQSLESGETGGTRKTSRPRGQADGRGGDCGAVRCIICSSQEPFLSKRNAARRSHVNDVPRSQFAVAVNHRTTGGISTFV
jgi:hypothetical protein